MTSQVKIRNKSVRGTLTRHQRYCDQSGQNQGSICQILLPIRGKPRIDMSEKLISQGKPGIVLLSWALRGPCCVHPRHLVLHFEWVNVPGHVVTNDETSSTPLCWSCCLIPNMHLSNYYETGWINLLDIESSPSKYWPMSIYQVGVTSVCYVYQKIVILMIPHTNFEMFDDSTHEYCIHPQRLSVLTEYLSLSLTYFTPTNLDNYFM